MKESHFVAFMILLNLFSTNAPEAYNEKTSDQLKVIGDGQCIWYDRCSDNPERLNEKLNCRYDGPAITLPSTSVSLLRETCPELITEITDNYGEIVTCCSPSQVVALSRQIATLNAILGNCPACISNLRNNFCYSTCHPRHSAFLNPTLLYNDSVYAVTQYSSYTYIDAAYDSCENVYFASINDSALNLLCGPWGAEYCTPERLFDYLGNNLLVAFNTSYVYGNENTTAPNVEDPSQFHPIYPFNIETHPCNSSDPDYTCDCQDCEESCQATQLYLHYF